VSAHCALRCGNRSDGLAASARGHKPRPVNAGGQAGSVSLRTSSCSYIFTPSASPLQRHVSHAHRFTLLSCFGLGERNGSTCEVARLPWCRSGTVREVSQLRHGSRSKAVAALPRSNSIGPHGSSRALPSRHVASIAQPHPNLALSNHDCHNVWLEQPRTTPAQPEPRQSQVLHHVVIRARMPNKGVPPVSGPLARVPIHLPGLSMSLGRRYQAY
jgi:hypothetical protein